MRRIRYLCDSQQQQRQQRQQEQRTSRKELAPEFGRGARPPAPFDF